MLRLKNDYGQVLELRKRKWSSIPYAPNLLGYLRFPPYDLDITKSYTKVLRVLWEQLYFSKDFNGAQATFQVLSKVDLVTPILLQQYALMLSSSEISSSNSKSSASFLKKLSDEVMKTSKRQFKAYKAKESTLITFLKLFLEGQCIDQVEDMIRLSQPEPHFRNSAILNGYNALLICYRSIQLSHAIHNELPEKQRLKLRYHELPSISDIIENPFQIHKSVSFLFQCSDNILPVRFRGQLRKMKAVIATTFNLDLLKKNDNASVKALYAAVLCSTGQLNRARKFVAQKARSSGTVVARLLHLRFLSSFEPASTDISTVLHDWIAESCVDDVSALHCLLLLQRESACITTKPARTTLLKKVALNKSKFSVIWFFDRLADALELIDQYPPTPDDYGITCSAARLAQLSAQWACWRALATVIGKLPEVPTDEPLDASSEAVHLIPSLARRLPVEQRYVNFADIRSPPPPPSPDARVGGGYGGVREALVQRRDWWATALLSPHQLGDCVGGLTEAIADSVMKDVNAQSPLDVSHLGLLFTYRNVRYSDENCEASVDEADDSEDSSLESDNKPDFWASRDDRGSDDDSMELFDGFDDDDLEGSYECDLLAKPRINQVKMEPSDLALSTDSDSSEPTYLEASDDTQMEIKRENVPMSQAIGDEVGEGTHANKSRQSVDIDDIWTEILRISRGGEVDGFPGELPSSPLQPSPESFSVGRAAFHPYQQQYWPRQCSRQHIDHMFAYDKHQFVLLGARRLELLAFQTLVCAHLRGQDSLFCARAAQIFVQHGAQRAGPALLWLQRNNFNVVRAIRVANLYYTEDVQCVAAPRAVVYTEEESVLTAASNMHMYQPQPRKRRRSETAC